MTSMKQLQQELLAEAKQGMLTPEGAESLHDEEIQDIAGIIIAGISGGAWAVMDEFGTGSEMDLFNPALPDYIQSDVWNPARGNDTTIRSRSNAPGQRDIFGNPISGKGAGGVDLEALGVVDAQLPSHAIETALRWMRHGRMREVIQQTVRAFPFGKFIIVTQK